MAFESMMIALLSQEAGAGDPNYEFDQSTYTLVGQDLYIGPGSYVYGFLSVMASTGGQPDMIANVGVYTYPAGIGSWHNTESITADIREGVQFRLTYQSGDAMHYAGMNLNQWYDAQAGVSPIYSWNWQFRSPGLSDYAEYLLEMRDSNSLVVLDSAVIQIQTLLLGAPS
jgi:hypothetical protein